MCNLPRYDDILKKWFTYLVAQCLTFLIEELQFRLMIFFSKFGLSMLVGCMYQKSL